ncbi:hypothetical protein EYC57_12250 [Xanthomonas oryzae]|nr:hypothetical protein EYC57_12250 [Xanthomonas oryzae]
MPPHSEQIVSRICGALFRGSLAFLLGICCNCCLDNCRKKTSARRIGLMPNTSIPLRLPSPRVA